MMAPPRERPASDGARRCTSPSCWPKRWLPCASARRRYSIARSVAAVTPKPSSTPHSPAARCWASTPTRTPWPHTARLSRFGSAFAAAEGNFRDLDDLRRARLQAGQRHSLRPRLSSDQLARTGASASAASPLDMRFSPDQDQTASDWVNESSEEDLANVIWQYGEERQSRRIARAIVGRRPIATSLDLAKAVEQAVGRRPGSQSHPATKTFQALRIVVNQELASLINALPRAHGLLGFGSSLVVISYHSLEDRIVKQFIQRESRDCVCPPGLPVCTCGHKATLKPITRGALQPSAAEVARNPRSRSAKLRAAERLSLSNGLAA